MTAKELDLPWEKIIALLTRGEMQIIGHFVHGSNYTFLVLLNGDSAQIHAVYKPVKGENPLWDFPNRTLAKRETASYVLSQWLRWELVPPTVLRKDGLLGAGSLQYFIEHDPKRHYFTLAASELEQLKPVALFDLVINNADRKGSHLIFDGQNRLWLIDHGLCFNTDNKLRTVIWDFAGTPVPANLLQDLERAPACLGRGAELFELLHPYLTLAEIKALRSRITSILETRTFPNPPGDRRSYPYPPL